MREIGAPMPADGVLSDSEMHGIDEEGAI